jgi:hypothetical protein
MIPLPQEYDPSLFNDQSIDPALLEMSTAGTVFEYESEPVEVLKIGGLNTSLKLPLVFKAAEFKSV